MSFLGTLATLSRIVVPTASASAFLNNTPIVAMAIPPVLSWCRRTGRSPSRFLMPVSFAAVVGGTITLIGTSTNLVVSGLMEDAGQEPMGLFEIGAVGLPLAIISVIVMVLVLNLDAIASIGSAVALLIFTLVTVGHLRIRADTGARLSILALAIATASVTLVTFVFTTLVNEPASMVTLAVIVLLALGLDLAWARLRLVTGAVAPA